MLQDSYYTNVCVRQSPSTIAFACLSLAAWYANVSLPTSINGSMVPECFVCEKEWVDGRSIVLPRRTFFKESLF